MQIQKILGLMAAPFTPMHPDGSVNLSIIPAYAGKLKSEGVRGVFVCGTTGEGMFMTHEERIRVTEKWMAEQTNDFMVLVHVGTTSAKQSAQLARHAQKSGAHAVGTMGPVFLKPSRVEELVGFCEEVAAGAPDLPFYYYHIPSVTGIDLPMYQFLKVASARIPNLAGIKFTHNNFMDMQLCLELDNQKWDIMHGYDELLLAGLLFGVVGAIGSTYNYMGPLYQGIIHDFASGDMDGARKKQLVSVRIIEILLRYHGALVSGKTLMQAVGIDCGPCRYPLNNLSADSFENMINELKTAGFFDLDGRLS